MAALGDGAAGLAHAARQIVESDRCRRGRRNSSARARMRAVEVLPTPRTPVRMKAWAIRPVAMALVSVLTIASCPISAGEALRPVFAREHAIGGAGLTHYDAGSILAGGGRLNSDPARNSLRLLPSGPDRVGEGPARRQPPEETISAPAPRVASASRVHVATPRRRRLPSRSSRALELGSFGKIRMGRSGHRAPTRDRSALFPLPRRRGGGGASANWVRLVKFDSGWPTRYLRTGPPLSIASRSFPFPAGEKGWEGNRTSAASTVFCG